MKTCENCGNDHSGEYGSGRFCSTKCSKGFSTKSKRSEINEKVSSSLKGVSTGNKVSRETRECSCGNSFTVRITSKQQYCGVSCRQSANGSKGGKQSIQGIRSKNEKLFATLCKEHFNDVICNEPIFNGWDADVILLNEKVAILWNGRWHYEKVTKNHSLEQVQTRDKIKLKEIQNAGYQSYVIKDMGKYNPKFVSDEFQKFLKHIAG